MLRPFISTRAQLFASALSTSLLLACGDDTDTKEEGAEVEEQSDAGHKSSKKPSEGKAGSPAKVDAGSPNDEAAAGGKGGQPAEEKPKDKTEPPAKKDEPKQDDKPKDDANKDTDKPAADKGGEEKLKVSLRFHAKVGKSDFACSHKYAAQGTANTTVTPLDLRLFVHAVELIKEDGSKVPLSLIAREPWQSEALALLDFEDKTGRCSDGTAETNTAITGTAPAGSYKGVSFVVGVPDELNHKDPASLAAPLKDAAGLSAMGVEGFRFAKVGLTQLNAAGDASGSGLFDLGSTQCTGSVADGNVKCEKANRNLIKLETFNLEKNSVVIDVAKLFAAVDLTQPQACHSVEKSCVPMFSAFGVSFASGQPEAEQQVFSVE
jgi:uncharacterized repeat protein (TIGR04052 family)